MTPLLPALDNTSFRNVWVVGAGAVGGYFGALLSRAGADVTFLVRSATYAKIAADGLQIKSKTGDFSVRPRVVQGVGSADSADLILLAVKCYDLIPAVAAVVPLIQKGATLLTLQNGVDSEERILSYFAASDIHNDCLVAGVTYLTARLVEPGVVEHSHRGIIALGALSDTTHERAHWVYQYLSNASIPSRFSDDIRKTKWEKLCWNATFNPLSAILGHPISLILHSDNLLQMVRRGIEEVIAVAACEGRILAPTITEDTITTSYPLQNCYTSMYEDYKNGKPTEIEHINGDIIRRGRNGRVPTPTHDMLYALMKGLEKKRGLT